MAEISMSPNSLCGWCMTGHHDNCKKEIKHYDSLWQCGCKECANDKAPL